MPDRRSHPLAAFTLAILAAAVVPGRADELPPKDAPAYSAVYQMRTQAREKAQDPWGYKKEDTVTVAVLAKQSRWTHKSDGQNLLYDSVSRTSTLWGGATPAGTAVRSRSGLTPIGWEFGYATVAFAAENKPEVLGKATIAGHECTRLRYVSDQYGEPEFCVTNTGIVLRFATASTTAEAVYEAQSVDEKAPDKSLFSPPADLKIEERAGAPRKAVKF